MPRVLAKRYAERDVPDVETYVRESVAGLGPLNSDDEEALVAKGIFLVRRIAFALPPEASLRVALREHFPEGLAALRDEAGPSSTDKDTDPAPAGTTSRAA
ncbi:MAG TPA: hypothetical protein VFB51_10270 [Solirubrobacterales bacterium]|nr:hypothetical protein [Solirubrobacterales bacterium]